MKSRVPGKRVHELVGFAIIAGSLDRVADAQYRFAI
jgi:hypothetical protein